jgi:transglutaminase-like putative cysteine protease
MMAPRGLIGAALLLWGASVGFLPVAIVLALAYEGARFAPASPAAAKRVTMVGRVVIFAVVAKLAYAAFTTPFPGALYAWLRWLPILLLPLPLVQALAGGTIPSHTLPGPMRPARGEAREVDTTYVYAAIVLVGAGTGAQVEDWYFAAAAFIVAWALVPRMPARSRVAGALMLAMGIGMGYAVHVGVRQLQDQVEAWSEELIIDFISAKADAMRERTRIGDLGKVKLSDRILMRVVPQGPRNLVLLREATFDSYQNGTWQNSLRAFQPVPGDGDRWVLRPGEAARALTIKRSLSGGEGVLALPPGTHAISRLPAQTMGVLANGTVRASGTPYLLSMAVTYDERLETQAPLPRDLAVGTSLEPVLDRVIREEGLDRAAPADRLAAVQALFGTKFAYSLILTDPKDPARARGIADFLLRDRKGHCEYFGTATVLLLRRLGIPARYAVGYSVQDWSDLERAFVVRSRHAHAWTQAYVDGRWIEVDTTPANWATSEAEGARSPLGPLLDLLSWAWDRMVDFWMEHSAAEVAAAIAVVFGGAGALVASVALWRRRVKRPKPARPTDKLGRAWRSLEKRLARRGAARLHDETPLAWARRVHAGGSEPWRSELLGLVGRYYRARFDPGAEAGIAEEVAAAAATIK